MEEARVEVDTAEVVMATVDVVVVLVTELAAVKTRGGNSSRGRKN